MVKHKDALHALESTLRERESEGSILDNDFFDGSCDRWAMAISELSRARDKGRILDIGAWNGMFCGALQRFGYSVAALDWGQPMSDSYWQEKGIEWHNCQIEADPIPFPDNEFMGVYMGQILEHFTYSPRKPFSEIKRVLKPGGILVVDVPNVGEFHNFYRLIRGRNILYDYKRHYIDDEPIFYKGLPYFNRHNREFTPHDLMVLAESSGFQVIKVSYIRSRRYRKYGLRRLEVPFTALRDVIPLFRKSLMLTAQKPS
jgi:SAM-dependent methyltransferase